MEETRWLDPAAILDQVIKLGSGGKYNLGDLWGTDDGTSYSYDVFPSTLGSDQLGHIMKMSAYTGGTAVTGPNPGTAPNQKRYDVLLFIPGGVGVGGGTMQFQDTHEYTDIKLTNIFNQMLGVSGTLGVMRRAINPAVQVIYRSTELRKFIFSFLLSPTNEDEAKSMYTIVQNLRMWSAPDLSNANTMFVSPAEWDISFFFNGQENTNIPKLRRCVLVRVTADYTSQGEWSTFKDGRPLSCLLTLEFEEMEIINRKYVQNGY